MTWAQNRILSTEVHDQKCVMVHYMATGSFDTEYVGEQLVLSSLSSLTHSYRQGREVAWKTVSEAS